MINYIALMLNFVGKKNVICAFSFYCVFCFVFFFLVSQYGELHSPSFDC